MARWLESIRLSFLDVRRGELGRTLLVGLYLLFVLFAYYILKPVSRSLFVNRFDLDKLPLLYILIAPAGGFLAYLYSRLAAQASLSTAVNWATAVSIAFTVGMGYLVQTGWTWTFYVFNIWVSMFSILLVTQGWVIAANVFTTREAKRLYGILGLGAVIGAGFGGTFTSFMVKPIGENNLILAAGVVTFVAYLMYRLLLRQPGVDLSRARATEEETAFSLKDVIGDVTRHRHLQVIVGIVLLMFMADVIVEYQFQAFAKARFQGRDLTAFFGSFHGVYLNLVNFVFQFFLTGAAIRWLGVGGVLQIMPVTISLAALGIYLQPGVWSSSLSRLSEAATRYTFNRTGMELLYLPLPLDLRNRVKAFLDIFVDRFGRGLGGVLLYLLTVRGHVDPADLSLLVLVLAAAWSGMSWLAQQEYRRTVRRRLESRVLTLGDNRLVFNDSAMVEQLESVALGDNARQAAYAVRLLAEAPAYDLDALLSRLTSSRHPEVRAQLFRLAQESGRTAFLSPALTEIRQARGIDDSVAVGPAVSYLIAVSPDAADLAPRLLDHPSATVADMAAAEMVNRQMPAAESWVAKAARGETRQRELAATLLAIGEGSSGSLLRELLADPAPSVVNAALRAAGKRGLRELIEPMTMRLSDARCRAAAVDGLAAFGPAISGTLGDLSLDLRLPESCRHRLPRVLAAIGGQRATDVLLSLLESPDTQLRDAALAALTRLREAMPAADFPSAATQRYVTAEAEQYAAGWCLLEPLKREPSPSAALRLLCQTLEARLGRGRERIFRLLALRYPAALVMNAHRALEKATGEDQSAALEFLDGLLDKELKRIVMPLLDDPARLADRAVALFGCSPFTFDGALRQLLRGGDEWLACCALTIMRDRGWRGLDGELAGRSRPWGPELERVLAGPVPGTENQEAAWPN